MRLLTGLPPHQEDMEINVLTLSSSNIDLTVEWNVGYSTRINDYLALTDFVIVARRATSCHRIWLLVSLPDRKQPVGYYCTLHSYSSHYTPDLPPRYIQTNRSICFSIPACTMVTSACLDHKCVDIV
jgi:hypothetical protein